MSRDTASPPRKPTPVYEYIRMKEKKSIKIGPGPKFYLRVYKSPWANIKIVRLL